MFSSGLLCREVRVGRVQKRAPGVTVIGRPCAPIACCRKCLAEQDKKAPASSQRTGRGRL